MNPPDSTSLAIVVEYCVAQGGDSAWRKFDEVFSERLESAFKQAAVGIWRARFNDFRPWFLNWVYRRRVLEAASRRLDRECKEGAPWSEADRSDFLANYLSKAARSSAIPEFISESGSTLDQLADQAFELRAPVALSSVEWSGDPREQLHPSYRVPFCLRHYRDLGYPVPADITWMSEQSGRSEDEVRRLLNEAIESGANAAFPIYAALIAELCGIAETLDGGQGAVDQRVRRARLKLRQILGAVRRGDD